MAQASFAQAERQASESETIRFREAMARLAGGVAIVACLDDGGPKGLLVSSLTCLSVEPPRLLFCVQKAAGAHDALLSAERCSVAILRQHDVEEAKRFSSSARTTERFSPAAWRMRTGEPPHYGAALVSLSGRIGSRLDAGSHSVLVLEVEAIMVRDAEPLVYFGRGFHGLAPLV